MSLGLGRRAGDRERTGRMKSEDGCRQPGVSRNLKEAGRWEPNREEETALRLLSTGWSKKGLECHIFCYE